MASTPWSIGSDAGYVPPTTYGYTGSGAPPDLSNLTNPYAAQQAADSASMLQGAQESAQRMNSLQGQVNAYPAYGNDYGLGSAIPGSASNPDYGTAPVTITMPDASSRGFNPWSLQGESIARGK